PKAARTAGAGLVRLQAERTSLAGRRGREPLRADRPCLGTGGCRDDEWWLRRPRRRVPGDPRTGRRGRLPVAAVVLLRTAHPRRRWDTGPGAAPATGLRPGLRRDRPRHHASDTGGPAQLAAQPERARLSDRGPPDARCGPR